MIRLLAVGTLLAFISFQTHAGENLTVRRVELTEWKAVFGRVEARDRVPARSRLGGTLVEVRITEGFRVTAGQQIANVVDEKLALQLGAIDASLQSLRSQLENAEAELERGENLLRRGVTTAQRLDALRTEVDVTRGRIGTVQAERNVLEQRKAEGAVLAPIDGIVLAVPVTVGSVVLPGEPIAEIGGGGFFLRLAVPERLAMHLREGDIIHIESPEGRQDGRLAKLYPQIENGRVVADVDVKGLRTEFVDARVLVRLPVATSEAVVVPLHAVTSRMGLDFVTIVGAEGEPVSRTVVLGTVHDLSGESVVEVLSGLSGGETLVTGHE